MTILNINHIQSKFYISEKLRENRLKISLVIDKETKYNKLVILFIIFAWRNTKLHGQILLLGKKEFYL